MTETDAFNLNADANSAWVDRGALQLAVDRHGKAFRSSLGEKHIHLFADTAVYANAAQFEQMRAVIKAVETTLGKIGTAKAGLGVCYGYDFHLNHDGAHLIEINTNAGGEFLCALLAGSQQLVTLPGRILTDTNIVQALATMFRSEWRSARGETPLRHIAIVDEQPESQYLYPEFLLAKSILESDGLIVHIIDPSELIRREDGLYIGQTRVDMIYNRLTDFSLRTFPHLLHAWQQEKIMVTPNPTHYAHYADKRKLVFLSDLEALREAGVTPENIATLLQGIPTTYLVEADEAESWWANRKQWFFKPVNGFGSKGAYRGDKLTKRVFEEILNAEYVAQRVAAPGERVVKTADGAIQSLKYDVRCYVYDGHVQLVVARLYQGQTTNFRTAGGGFATVRSVG